MKLALLEAKKAYKKLEVPVGCVIVLNGEVIAKAHNLRETKQTSLAHAEILAINKACKKIGSWRLEDCQMFVTLEPCPMCGGAIIQSRIKDLYYGASDEKSGVCGGKINLFETSFNHEVNVIGGIMQDDCKSLLQGFFKELRMRKENNQ